MDTDLLNMEKIKAHEQDNEAILKEKREIEDEAAQLNRAIKEADLKIVRADIEIKELSKQTLSLKSLLLLERLRYETMLSQLNNGEIILNKLRSSSETGISELWDKRTALCKDIHDLSNKCDIRSLMAKPRCAEIVAAPTAIEDELAEDDTDDTFVKSAVRRHELAKERKQKIDAELDRLRTEPDVADDFVRIKNVLNYALSQTAELQKSKVRT